MSEHYRFGTLAVHAGQTPDETTGAIMPPIYQTSTYVQPKLGEPKRGYEYARVQNPTREAMEANIAALEGGKYGMAFASGMAAIEAITKRLSAGDHVIYEENVYGGTHRMFVQVLARFGMQFTALDCRDLDAVRDAIRPNTRLIHIETPTNPMMRVSDLRALVQIAHEREITVAVDNTFASPYNQRPLELGADVVVHSSTKYLNGHSDVIGGIAITSDEQIAADLRFLQKAAGAVPGPWDSWLVLRGTKTLHVRMQAHNANGAAHCRVPGEAPRIGSRTLPRPSLPSAARAGEVPDAGLHGDGFVRARLPGARRPRRAGHAPFCAGREPGRGGEFDWPPRDHDPRLRAQGNARPHGRKRRFAALVSGD